MKSVCSGPCPVKLQVSIVVILEPVLILYEHVFSPITNGNFLHCSLHPFSYPVTVGNNLSLSPLHTSIRQLSGLLPVSLPFSRLKNPSSHSLPLHTLCSCPEQPVSHCWAPSSTSASLFYWGAPNWAQCSTCSLFSAKEWMEKDCCPQQYSSSEQSSAGLHGPGYNLVVLPRHILNCSKSKNNCRNC